MAVQLIDLLAPLVGMAMTVGGILLLVGAVGGFWIGRASSDPGGIQARLTVRELQSSRKKLDRQLAAARDAAGALLMHPTTHPHTRIMIEEHLVPLLAERRVS